MENNNFYIDFLDLVNDCYFENHYYFDDSFSVLFKNIDLPIIKYKYLNDKLKQSNEECLISLHKFNNDDDVILLPCEHIFLKEPIQKWIHNFSYTCPKCRKKL
jgi:hypothetical protein|tara:strand:- start:89 stop:397 length:309 start_codon:yes stop_codon:yes gene_type:complete